jgi:hypothetical protein
MSLNFDLKYVVHRNRKIDESATTSTSGSTNVDAANNGKTLL